jgi:26S proteasome regulatory subunit (ATPase 3-interacting protein)
MQFRYTSLYSWSTSDSLMSTKNPNDSYAPEQLTQLDTTIAGLRTQTTSLVATAKTLRSTLSSLNSTLSTADLIANVQALEAEKTEILGRLESFRKGNAKKVTKRERDEVERQWKNWGTSARKRQKISGSVWGVIEDAVQEKDKRAELREELGLDE